MNTSDTPMTDAEAGYYDGSGCWKYRENGETVPSDFARDLERQLTAEREKNAAITKELNALSSELGNPAVEFDPPTFPIEAALFRFAVKRFQELRDENVKLREEVLEEAAKIVEASTLPDLYSEACLPDIANDIRAMKGKK